jgi:TRAP-type C4-dicarboxylate transport system substrate-binding protein
MKRHPYLALIFTLVIVTACTPAAQQPVSPTAAVASTTSAIPKGRLGPGPSVTLKWAIGPNRQSSPYLYISDWPKKLEELSGGRVKFQVVLVDELGLSQFQALTLAGQGVVDITWTGFGVASGTFPLLEAPELPFITGGSLDTAEKLLAAYMPKIEEPLAQKLKVKVLSSFPSAAQVLYCKGSPTSIADLRGKKIRTFSTGLNDFFEGVGAVGVALTFPEVYTGLERGVIDCGATGTNAGLNSKWYEVSDTLINIPLTFGLNLYAISDDTWNRLPPDVQEFLTFHFGGEMRATLVGAITKSTVADVACLTGSASCTGSAKGNLKEVKASASDTALIQKMLQEIVVPRWSKRCGQGCADIFNSTIAPIVNIRAP